MKKIDFLLFAFILFACGQTTNKQQENISVTNSEKSKDSDNSKDKYIGTFEYVNPYNTEGQNENEYIVISKIDSEYSGIFYGTSDEFDESREGYVPGYFVASMTDLRIVEDTIKFTLSVLKDDIFDKPVDLKLKSSDEARNSGYNKWIQVLEFQPRKYSGLLNSEGIIFKESPSDKLFKKK